VGGNFERVLLQKKVPEGEEGGPCSGKKRILTGKKFNERKKGVLRSERQERGRTQVFGAIGVGRWEKSHWGGERGGGRA